MKEYYCFYSPANNITINNGFSIWAFISPELWSLHNFMIIHFLIALMVQILPILIFSELMSETPYLGLIPIIFVRVVFGIFGNKWRRNLFDKINKSDDFTVIPDSFSLEAFILTAIWSVKNGLIYIFILAIIVGFIVALTSSILMLAIILSVSFKFLVGLYGNRLFIKKLTNMGFNYITIKANNENEVRNFLAHKDKHNL